MGLPKNLELATAQVPAENGRQEAYHFSSAELWKMPRKIVVMQKASVFQ